MKKKYYAVIFIFLLILSIPFSFNFFSKASKDKFDFSTYSKSSFTIDCKNGSYTVCYGTLGKGDSLKPLPMLIYLNDMNVNPIVLSGWGNESGNVFGIITLNGNVHKVPLTSVVFVDPNSNSYRIISNYWNPYLFNNKDKSENFVKELLGL